MLPDIRTAGSCGDRSAGCAYRAVASTSAGRAASDGDRSIGPWRFDGINVVTRRNGRKALDRPDRGHPTIPLT